MLENEITKYANWTEGGPINYNCAEAVLHACDDYYNLGLSEETFKAIAPLGGGFYCGKTCGLLTGSLASIGALFSTEVPYADGEMQELMKEWVGIFENEFGSIDCPEVKKAGPNCDELAVRAAKILEDFIDSKKSMKG